MSDSGYFVNLIRIGYDFMADSIMNEIRYGTYPEDSIQYAHLIIMLVTGTELLIDKILVSANEDFIAFYIKNPDCPYKDTKAVLQLLSPEELGDNINFNGPFEGQGPAYKIVLKNLDPKYEKIINERVPTDYEKFFWWYYDNKHPDSKYVGFTLKQKENGDVEIYMKKHYPNYTYFPLCKYVDFTPTGRPMLRLLVYPMVAVNTHMFIVKIIPELAKL